MLFLLSKSFTATTFSSCFLWVFLPSIYFSLIKEKYALLSRDQVTNKAIEDFPILLPWETLRLILLHFD